MGGENTMSEAKGDYEAFYKDLVSAIRGEQELVVKPQQSRHGIRVIDLAKESAEIGCTIVPGCKKYFSWEIFVTHSCDSK